MGGQPGGASPLWATAHMMAKEYGIPPWQVEEQCSMEWLRQWLTFREAEAQEMKRQEQKGAHAKRR